MKKMICEIIDEFVAAPSRAEKITVLQKNDSPRLRMFFELLYGPVKFKVDIPNYKPAPEPIGLNWTYLDNELPKLYRFTVDSQLTDSKKTSLLAPILEGLYKDEAKLLVGLLNKDLGIKYLTPKIVKEALSINI
jgi:hypothetical protein